CLQHHSAPRLKDKLARECKSIRTWSPGLPTTATGRPQYVRLKDCMSETVVSSTGGSTTGGLYSPLSSSPTIHLRLRYNSETCHMQKFSDDTAIVACVRGGQEAEYRKKPGGGLCGMVP
ncbi:hypothetical protein NFI96_007434, partial [Prochilodus magdalenae]